MSHRHDPHGDLWELIETLLLILLGIVAVCGVAGYVYARFGDDVERAYFVIAQTAWTLAGRWF